MSRRLQMLQVARLAQRSLGDAADLVAGFIHRLALPDGSFANRDGKSDLYYTSFALDGLAALDRFPDSQLPDVSGPTLGWLETFGDGQELDFVHRCCLARAWAAQPRRSWPAGRGKAIAERILHNRARDGGFATRADSYAGTAYGCFLAVNALDDLGQPPMPAAQRQAVLDCISRLRSGDGGWANAPGQPQGSTTATAAAVATLQTLDAAIPQEAGPFLLAQQHLSGGFLAAPDAPIPDLLSTAVALHALDVLDTDWRGRKDLVLDFLDSLWSAAGGFHGSWADDVIDAEYTYYGLVALGHASV